MSYANLPLEELVARGWLVDKATGDPLAVGGKEIRSEKAFEPISPYGTVEVDFAFDASGLAGTDIVVFEQILLDGEGDRRARRPARRGPDGGGGGSPRDRDGGHRRGRR